MLMFFYIHNMINIMKQIKKIFVALMTYDFVTF